MSTTPSRPWRRSIHGLSRFGIVLLGMGICTFGYGIVNLGLPSSADDRSSANLIGLEEEADDAAKRTTDPAARERLRQWANNLALAQDRYVRSSMQKNDKHVKIAFVGAGLSLLGFTVLILHRRRTRNLV